MPSHTRGHKCRLRHWRALALARARARGLDVAGRTSTSARAGRPAAVVSRILAHHKCPITHELLIDPVIAEDGHVYERAALERWLSRNKTSPTTNQPMGAAVVPSIVARQTIGELADHGMLDEETLVHFLSSRGRLRSSRPGGAGPDLEGARKDFEMCLQLGISPAQRRVIEFQLDTVRWMLEGAGLFGEAKAVEAELQAAAISPSFDLRAWLLDVSEVARSAVKWPVLGATRLSRWADLPTGARVLVLDDVAELERLCQRNAPGAEKRVEWNPKMAVFAGKICVVKAMGDKEHMHYDLRLEDADAEDSESEGRKSFWFPYDALFSLNDAQLQEG